ncbi:MAG: hypothetical protein GVY07_14955 [Bacteroidetes bacterium]|jgi:hypothetical protein|nr:hypothetical protein [Bacteroidota bacterium]
MTKKKDDDQDIIKSIKNRLGAESELYEPDEDELQFLYERNRLEEETAWRTDMYAKNYEQLKAYGLDDKLMRELDATIEYWLENRPQEFFNSEFYRQFRTHETVVKATEEYFKSNNK